MPGTFFQRALGAYQIVHHLRTFGYTCQVIEFAQYFTEDELTDTISKLITSDTLAVGISTTWFDQNVVKDPIRQYLSFKPGLPDSIVSSLNSIKTRHPSIKFIAGGAATKEYKNSKLFDYVIFSYAEDKMLQLANSLSGRTNFKPFNVETLEHRFLDQDVILEGETLPIEISRGCIFKCAFCSFPLNGKHKLDYIRSPKLIAQEMQYNYDKFGTVNYLFTDDTFNDTTHKIRSLHQEISKLPFKINFISYLRLDLLYAHQEQIEMLKDMGLKVAAFGIETFHPTAGKAIGKNMSANKIKQFLDDLQNKYWSGDVRIHCHMLAGLPGEPMSSVKESVEWLHSRPFSVLYGSFDINEKSEDKSMIATDPAAYGYHLDEKGEWHNGVTSQRQTQMFYAKHFAMMAKKGILYDGFGLMGAFKHYNYHKVMSLTWKDVVDNSEQIHLEKIGFIQEYKQRLLRYVTNSKK